VSTLSCNLREIAVDRFNTGIFANKSFLALIAFGVRIASSLLNKAFHSSRADRADREIISIPINSIFHAKFCAPLLKSFIFLVLVAPIQIPAEELPTGTREEASYCKSDCGREESRDNNNIAVSWVGQPIANRNGGIRIHVSDLILLFTLFGFFSGIICCGYYTMKISKSQYSDKNGGRK